MNVSHLFEQRLMSTRAMMLTLASLLPATQLLAQLPPLQSAENGFRPYELQNASADKVAIELRRSLNDKAQVLVDRAGNRILLRGDEASVRIAQQVIDRADMPSTAAAAPQRLPAEARPQVKSYLVQPDRLNAIANQLQRQFAYDTNVRITTNIKTGQLLVVAPAQPQSLIANEMEKLGYRPTAAANERPSLADRPTVRKSYQLKNSTSRDLEAGLQNVWRGLLAGEQDPTGATAVYRLTRQGNTATKIAIDRAENTVRLEGPDVEVASWLRLVESIDNPTPFQKGEASLLHATKTDSQAVSKAMSLLNALGQSVANNKSIDILTTIGNKQGPGWGGRFVSMIFRPQGDGENEGTDNDDTTEGEGQSPDDAGTGDGTNGGNEAEDEGPLGGLLGSVRIEFLEGLDIIIIRGHPEDVARVNKLIEQIQSRALDTEPDVQVYQLQNVNSRAITGIITQLYEEVYAPRQGPVSITPLVKPNALLLVGRPENTASVVELLKKLDVPVPPATQIDVVMLKFMSAIDAATRIDGLYNTPSQSQDPNEQVLGLSVRVRAIPDYRANALVLQASPRDLAEVKDFIRKIDVADNASLHEVKIFGLRNALATELAPVLQDALNGQLEGAGRATTGQNQPQTTNQQTQSRVRSAMLSFMTVDREGGRMLQSGILFDVRVIADTNSNSLIVVGPSNSMKLIDALIRQLDQLPGAEAQIKVFTIVNGDATNLAVMLQQLFGQEVTAGQGGFGQAAFLRSAFPTTSAGGEGSLVPLRIAVDQRTNSIVVSGNEGDLTVVEAILARLDEDGIETRRNTVYRLQNAPAADVAAAITEVLTRQQQASLSALTGVLSPAEQFEREVFIVPEPVSNSLIISSTPRYFDNILGVIKDLDQRPPMVMIQVLIAEVRYDDEFEFGFEMGFQDSLVFDRGIGVVGYPFNQAAIGNNSDALALAGRELLAGQALSNLSIGRTNAQLGYGGMVLTAGNESINFLLRALQNNRAVQVLSRPQIMTLDNQVAFVQIGARVARILGGSVTPQGGTTQNVTDVDVGIILRVQPRISPDGTVVMLLDTERSEVSDTEGTVVGFAADNTPLVSQNINTVTAQTTLSARSGQTVVFAGLMTNNKATERRSVPVLGTLPGIGAAFRYDRELEERSELLIVMTPYIIKDDEDYEWINRMEMDRMSWCLSDVMSVHSNLGQGLGAGYWEGGSSEVVYPDMNPTGRPNGPRPERVNAPEPTPAPAPVPPPMKSSRRSPQANQRSTAQKKPGPFKASHPLHERNIRYGDHPLNKRSEDYHPELGAVQATAHTKVSYGDHPGVSSQSGFRQPAPVHRVDRADYTGSPASGGAFIPSYSSGDQQSYPPPR